MKNYKRRYGIEIEISRQLLCINNQDKRYGPAWNDMSTMLNNLYSEGKISRGWRLKVDTSCGGEIVSPILNGPSGMSDVAIICKGINAVAKSYGVPAADAECGLHVHIDAQNIAARQVSNLFTLLHAAEPIIYSMYTARNLEYCAPMSMNMKLASKARDFTDIRDIWYRPSNNVKNPNKTYTTAFINGSSSGDMYDGTRYHGFNIHCFWRQGTVEFRYAGGTTDPLQIYAYYLMCQAMMERAMSDTKPNTSDSLKAMDFPALTTYYKSGNRFRKMIKNFAKDCELPKPAVRLITSLIRKSNPHLLDKSTNVVGKRKKRIDDSGVYNYMFSLDGVVLDSSGRKIREDRLKEMLKDNRYTLIPVELDYSLVNGESIALKSASPDYVFRTNVYYNASYKTRRSKLVKSLGEVDMSLKESPLGESISQEIDY